MLFDNAALESQLAKIPHTENNAIALGVTEEGAKVTVLIERDKHWAIKGIYEQNWSGSRSMAGEIIFHW